MAKTSAAKKAPKTKASKAEIAETDKEPVSVAKSDSGYGVDALASELGLTAFTIRMKLRAAGVEKQGRTYSWSSKKEFESVLKTLKSTKLKNEKSAAE